MKRRQFFTTAAVASLGTIGGYGIGRARSVEQDPDSPVIETLGGMTLEEHRDKYRDDLFNRFLPNMDESVIDHENGGFMCAVNIQTGERTNDNKRAWYEGRGMWVYSFLFNNVEQDSRYLEIARKSKDFILPLEPSGDEFWPTTISRDGEPLSGPGDIYGNLFIAEGLAEYSKGSGEREYYDRAREMVLSCFERYEDPSYSYRSDSLGIPNTRVVGHWMIFLRLVTQMLEHEADPQLEEIADRCVDALLTGHLNSEYNLMNEYLNHDLSLPENEYSNYSNTGHSIETLWMVMFEAERRQDNELFQTARDLFKRHITVAQDAVYGGYFHQLEHVNDYNWGVNKVLWLQEEILIGTLFLIEHTGDPWAQKVFADTDAYVREKYTRPGYKFWTSGADRKLEEHNMVRAEHYHHPRQLMLNLLAVERMIERGGRITGRFA
ncbi:MAG: AGE family epimerase/isomerase [Balneolaceae bacterium]